MPYQVALLNFEGPLDLLLQLVEGSRLEITSLSLATVTEQYLHYMNQLVALEPAELNQFIELATRLTYIKSLALLPSSKPDEDLEVSSLRAELAEYQQYQAAAQTLGQLLVGGPASHRRSIRVSLSESERPLPTISLEQLQTAFGDVLQRLPPTAENTIGKSITFEEMVELLTAYVDREPRPLRQFLETLKDRMEVIVAFLAILELVKDDRLSVTQDKQFSDMMIGNDR